MKHISDEEKSSAVTLSDMEIFIFPELMYSLVLANILSPRIWKWRELEWFDGIREMRPKKRLLSSILLNNAKYSCHNDTLLAQNSKNNKRARNENHTLISCSFLYFTL